MSETLPQSCDEPKAENSAGNGSPEQAHEPIAFARPWVGQEEIDAVVSVLKSGWLTTGAVNKKFEAEFAEFVNAPRAVALNSATAGLHLALEGLGIGPGDKVLTPAYTFTATAEVARYLGADPVFVDVDPVSCNIDPVKLAEVAERVPEAKVIMPVHFGGQVCDMDRIQEIARKHDLRIVEDAAHALPATWNGEMIGSISDATVFSFYATKTITTGEGGMVTTANEELAHRMSCMRLHGIDRDVFNRYTSNNAPWYYEVIAPGYKYNMTDVAAAIGRVQLKQARKFQQQREGISARYTAAFADLPVRLPRNGVPESTHSWHLYMLQLELDQITISRDEFILAMRDAGVGTSVHYLPLHMQPYWRDQYGLKEDDFPVASDIFSRCVSIPIWQGMSDGQVERVVDAVSSILTRAKR